MDALAGIRSVDILDRWICVVGRRGIPTVGTGAELSLCFILCAVSVTADHTGRSSMRSNRMGSFAKAVGFLCLFSCLASVLLYAREQPEPHHPRVRVHFIAADEVDWDYAPLGHDEAMGHPFDDFFVEGGPHRVGRVPKKCVYR